MFEKLTAAVKARAAKAVAQQIDQLARTPTPPGVRVEPRDSGIALTGKRLRRRMLTDANIRNFGR